MAEILSGDARLSLRGHEPRPAALEIEHRSPKTRMTRALLSLVGFWVLTPIVALVSHLVYGAILGAFYQLAAR